jgi:hypothetical protein
MRLSEGQEAVLHQNTVISVMSGLAVRYHDEFRRLTGAWTRVGELEDDPLAPAHAKRAEQYQEALIAEVPLGFSLEPSNMAVSVKVNKINPHNGELIDGSDYQVGLVGGLAGDGRPSKPFTDEDLKLAVEQLRKQKQAGLVYGLPSGSGFLKDY